MPAGIPWLTEEPTWLREPTHQLFRVHPAAYDAFAPNPNSQARFALPGHYAMFYAADSLEGALWEALLRYVVLKPKGQCDLPTARLTGQVVSKVRLKAPGARLIQLSRPGLLHLFPDGDSAVHAEVKMLLTTPNHLGTHAEANALHECLKGLTPPIDDMPMLSWQSRQFEKSTVYLSYHKKGAPHAWEQIGASQELDTPEGYLMIRDVLLQHGFHWTPVNTLPTAMIDDEAP